MSQAPIVIAVLGGTGALGSGLARRWAQAGYQVILGSRDPARAQETLASLNEALGAARPITAAAYADAAAAAAVVALTVPFASQADILTAVKPQLAGKVLIDCTVPLRPPRVGRVQLPPEGSAAQLAQALVGPEVKVVSAFQNIGAAHLQSDAAHIDCDVLVCSDDDEARALGVTLAQAAGLTAYQAGPLANAAAAEALTSVLIQINRRYKADHAGIRITGLGHGE
jgi:NADPH-dependent F420 reductase